MAASLQGVASTGGSGSTTHTTSSTPFTSTSGGYAVITFAYDGSAPTAVTDNKGNTYTLINSGTFGGLRFWMYGCANAVGGAGHYATITTPGNGWPSMHFAMFQGITTSPVDIRTTFNEFGQPWEIASGTLAQADEVVVALCAFDGTGGNGQTWSDGAGFTLAAGLGDGSNYWPSALFYKVVSSTASVTASMSTDNGPAQSAGAGMMMLSLKASAGGGGDLSVSAAQTAAATTQTATLAARAALSATQTAAATTQTATLAARASVAVCVVAAVV
ncbi:MAG: hypothetical protein EOO54_22640, partial [Haliea sp.]